ncbi:MAG: adenosine deaminase, partial [Calditrichaeota bacterium]|nr:adenosine deaminase [Calditrichota bacterium]
MSVSLEFAKQIPKTDLHVHLDGSLRIDTIFELAELQKTKLPVNSETELRELLGAGKQFKSLTDYLKGFEITLSVMQDYDAIKRCAFELVEDSARENIKYLELRYSPILHQEKGLALTDIVDAVIEGLYEAEMKYDIRTGIIICGIRNINPQSSLVLAELTAQYKDKGVIAFDLAGAEENYPAKDHKAAFDLILKQNLNCTLHAGEAFGPDSIHQALHYCGAHRIGHGTRLKEDTDLLNYVNDHRIPLEICLTSNIQTKAAESWEMHPFRYYYDYGIRVTLNTDNRLISNTTMSNELYL